MRSSLVAVVALVAFLSSGASAQRSRESELVTLVVEVLDRDMTPAYRCGVLGPQPRDVTARVLSVEAGTFSAERVLLRWPLCGSDEVQPGERFRIQIRRWTDVPHRPDTRYRVRHALARLAR